MLWIGAECLPRHLDKLDILLEQVIDQRREVHALGIGERGQSGLHLVIEIDRQIELGAGLKNFPRVPFEKSISAGMSSSCVLVLMMSPIGVRSRTAHVRGAWLPAPK